MAGPQGLIPSAMQEGLGVPPATRALHLKELSAAGLIASEREGRSLIYRAEFAQLNALLGYLGAHCCQGSGSCAPTPCCPVSAQETA